MIYNVLFIKKHYLLEYKALFIKKRNPNLNRQLYANGSSILLNAF